MHVYNEKEKIKKIQNIQCAEEKDTGKLNVSVKNCAEGETANSKKISSIEKKLNMH